MTTETVETEKKEMPEWAMKETNLASALWDTVGKWSKGMSYTQIMGSLELTKQSVMDVFKNHRDNLSNGEATETPTQQ